ncbi:MAG: nucleotidyl transferase AbiEii/AbiGii toxin family protein [candidate division WOR-3 bacterium]
MELKRKILRREHKKAIKKIFSVLEKGQFYLANETAVYYYLLHRHSVDLDFFTKKDIDFRNFHSYFNPSEIQLISKDTIHSKIEGINISFFFYPYPLLKPLKKSDLIKVASLEDILCMKVNAIISRGSRKDFIDSYFIMKALKLNGNKVINFFKKKFGDYDEMLIKKAFTYFEDAEKEPDFPTIKKVSWTKVKNFFIREFAKI